MSRQYQTTVPTQTILTGSFVKFSRLGQLVQAAFHGSKATSINLYIDLYGIIKTLFSDSFRTDISDYTAVTSTIINMCGHYRSFFKSLGVTSKIFMVFSYNCCNINRQLVAGYNKNFYEKIDNKLIHDMVELNCKLLSLMCPYLPDVHFLRTEFESTVLINHLINREKELGNNSPNIIISKDIYPCQITYLHDDTAFIKPKKLNGDDVSVVIVPRNNPAYFESFWSVFCSTRGITVDKGSIMIHPMNFPILSALSRFPERNIVGNGMMTIPKASKVIYGLVGSNPIKVYPSVIAETEYSMTISVNKVDSRFKAIDIEFVDNLFKDSIECKTIHYDNLHDPAAINMICAQYFEQNPIDLQRL